MPFDLSKIIRPNIVNLSPYSSARDEYSGSGSILLDANENPFNDPVNRYPDPMQRNLKAKISDLLGTPPNHIFLGNGSDEAIDLLIRAFCVPSVSNIITIDPTYGMYEVSAATNDIPLIRVSLNADFSLNANALLNAVNLNTRIIMLCSPNNPTANLLDRGEMLRIARNFNGLLVVDEAYIDFSGNNGLLEDLSAFPNLVLLRTFSKAWGLAGIRLGMAIASDEIIKILSKIKYPYNINRLTQEYALKTIADPSKKEKWVKTIIEERQNLESELDKLPFLLKRYPSDANFILARFSNAKEVYNFLREKGLIVRDRSKVLLCDNCLRITVGAPNENRLLLHELKNSPF